MLEDTTVSTEVDLSNLELNEALPDYVVNILLLGVDNRSVELVSGRRTPTSSVPSTRRTAPSS